MNMPTRPKDVTIRAEYLLCLTALLWSTGGVLIKSIDLGPMAIAGMRSALAIPVLLLVTRRGHLNFSRAQIAASICYAVNVTLFVWSNKLTTAANAILLQYMAPVYVAIFSGLFLAERIKKTDWACIAVALAGMSLFFFGKLAPGHLLGNILAVISGLSFAFYIIFMRMQKNAHPLGSVLLGNIITALIALPFMLKTVSSSVNWTPLILLGSIQLGLSHVIYSAAIKRATALKATMIPMIEPILNPLWVFLFIHELPAVWTFIGGFVVIAAVAAHSLISASAENKPPK